MTIQFDCPTCKRKLRAPESSAGKKGKCPGCQKVFQVPAPVYEAEEERSSIVEIDGQAPEYQPEIDEPESDGGEPLDETSVPVPRRRGVAPAMIRWDMLVLAGAAFVCISFVVPWWRISETLPVAGERERTRLLVIEAGLNGDTAQSDVAGGSSATCPRAKAT